jgi:mono/diheme cytochrome c family protein
LTTWRAAALPRCLVLLVLAAGPAAAQEAPTPAQSIAAGSRVYGTKGCGDCHAINGVGQTVGPDLSRLGAPSLAGVVAAVWNHLPGMAARLEAAGKRAARIEPWEAADLVAFLFWAGAWTPPGDVEAGRVLFTSRQCVLCHRAGGVGGVLGPALDGLRERASTIDIAAALWNHAPAMGAEMRARRIPRPILTGRELNDLVAFFGTTGDVLPAEPVHALGGSPDRGEGLFGTKGCVRCHRVGGEGPDLTAVAPREPSAFAAAMWNKGGPMLDAMRVARIPVPSFTGAEMADLVAYLGTVQYLAGTGSASRGRQVAAGSACGGCHGRAIPRLSRAGGQVRRGAAIAALWNHVALAADSLRRAWRPLTAPHVADVMAYLESRGREP